MPKFKRVAIIAKPHGNISRYVCDLIEIVKSCGCDVIIDEDAQHHLRTLSNFDQVHVGSLQEIVREADVAISLGGDGTMLGAARSVAPYQVPLIGINAGRLGFITDIVLEQMQRLLPEILQGNYIVDKRHLLEGSIFRDGNRICEELSVNDICVNHGRALGMVEYTVYVDGLQMAVQRADGVIVSSGTGSTAYAMAAGGPIMHPAVQSMLLVPIAPHTLSNRPIVLSRDSVIEIEINETRSAVASFDAQTLFDVEVGDIVRVHRSQHHFTLLHPPGYNYFDLLRRKLKWNYLPQADRPIHTPVHKQTFPTQLKSPSPGPRKV